jgi:hypothetical protein
MPPFFLSLSLQGDRVTPFRQVCLSREMNCKNETRP